MAASGQDRGYLQWMLDKDFSEEVKEILRAALDGEVFLQGGRLRTRTRAR